jgi:8-oxo-dGTP pyrophosphatase MutT (NUDIX family)
MWWSSGNPSDMQTTGRVRQLTGYVGTGETLQEAAIRETYEEAGATATHRCLLAVYNLPMFSEVYVLFSADLNTPQLMGIRRSSWREKNPSK